MLRGTHEVLGTKHAGRGSTGSADRPADRVSCRKFTIPDLLVDFGNNEDWQMPGFLDTVCRAGPLPAQKPRAKQCSHRGGQHDAQAVPRQNE
jgi:hypothetical protein